MSQIHQHHHSIKYTMMTLLHNAKHCACFCDFARCVLLQNRATMRTHIHTNDVVHDDFEGCLCAGWEEGGGGDIRTRIQSARRTEASAHTRALRESQSAPTARTTLPELWAWPAHPVAVTSRWCAAVTASPNPRTLFTGGLLVRTGP